MLKSPVLSRLQYNDLYSFCIVMNQYLKTAISLYNPNIETEKRVSDFISSEEATETFDGDGVETSFSLGGSITISGDTIFQVLIDGEISVDYKVDIVDRKVEFNTAPLDGVEIEINYLNEGYFNSLTNEDVTLLSMALCLAWAIQTQNNQLDIDRQPSDSDFRLHSESTTIKGKVDWVKHFEQMYKRELSKSDWRPLFRKKV